MEKDYDNIDVVAVSILGNYFKAKQARSKIGKERKTAMAKVNQEYRQKMKLLDRDILSLFNAAAGLIGKKNVNKLIAKTLANLPDDEPVLTVEDVAKEKYINKKDNENNKDK